MNKSIGATLLIAGCAIGAGMLGLPVMTGAAGFLPSSLLLVASWAFMALSGLVLADLVISFNEPDVNLITLATKYLGKVGKWVTCLLFALLFYAIMVAYSLGGGIFIADFVQTFCSIALPIPYASSILVALLFIPLSRGVGYVDSFNRFLMVGLAACYVALIGVGVAHVEPKYLERVEWSAAWVSLPILVISFGYHNLIPSLASYLDQNRPALKRAILVGSFIPLVIYLLWEAVILGLIPFATQAEWAQAQDSGEMITQVLARASGSQILNHIARGFAFFAITTSFLPIALSFIDFLKDGFHIKETKVNRFFLASLVLLPPLAIAVINPSMFLLALNYAGGFCATILFSLLPALMAWKRKLWNRAILTILLLGSVAILAIELIQEVKKLLG